MASEMAGNEKMTLSPLPGFGTRSALIILTCHFPTQDCRTRKARPSGNRPPTFHFLFVYSLPGRSSAAEERNRDNVNRAADATPRNGEGGPTAGAMRTIKDREKSEDSVGSVHTPPALSRT